MNATIDLCRYSGVMTSLESPLVRSRIELDIVPREPSTMSVTEASTYASWFASLSDPTRVRLLHRVAGSPAGITIGELAEALGIGQPTISYHVRKLAEVGFVNVHKDGTSTVVMVNPACCTGLPHAADVVMGVLSPRPCCPDDLPADVTVRAMRDDDWIVVERIYAEGIATRTATFETEVPTRTHLDSQWLPGHRWVAEIDGTVVGWAALRSASGQSGSNGVVENSLFVAEGMRSRGVGKALLRRQVIAADEAGIWTVQTSIFPENRAGIALHHSAGFRTVGVRERIGQVDGQWRDTVFLERRTPNSAAV